MGEDSRSCSRGLVGVGMFSGSSRPPLVLANSREERADFEESSDSSYLRLLTSCCKESKGAGLPHPVSPGVNLRECLCQKLGGSTPSQLKGSRLRLGSRCVRPRPSVLGLRPRR